MNENMKRQINEDNIQ